MSNKCLKGNLGDVTNQWSAWAQKKFRKKNNQTEIHFSTFIENQNWDLKFVFRFDTENEKRKKIKILFYFKTEVECPFGPTDWIVYLTAKPFFSVFKF